MFTIDFAPKDNAGIQKTLESIRQKELFDGSGWPLANDHIAIIKKDGRVLGSYDSAVDSTDFMFSSIPRGKTFKGRFGVHFTKSFGGNHISIALTDMNRDFVRLERSWIFNVGFGLGKRQVKIYDTRGYIKLDEPQYGTDRIKSNKDIDLIKMDVEVHMGNKYYKSPILSKGCPTIHAGYYNKFLREIFANTSGSIMDTEFEVTIAPLPDKEDESFSDFYKLYNGLLVMRRQKHENTLKDMELGNGR
jgi:hypothetical protein